MKQTTKIILHSSSHLLLFSLVIFAAHGIKQSLVLNDQPSSPPQVTPVASQKTEQTNSSVVLAPSQPAAPMIPASLSPKHDEIKQSAKQEYVYRMFLAPNDPSYNDNWALNKINAPAAWDIATGNGQTVVAVIDGGFALAHEDLADRWQTNTDETGMTASGDLCWTGSAAPKHTNGCDDDNNGYVDDWRGWSFVLGDNNPQAGRENTDGDGTRHATQVAGIVGASSNNSIGVAALNWDTKIMPLQALSDDGYGYTSDVAAAIYYAVDNSAQVVNLSLGSYGDDPVVRAAVNYATSRNVVVVAAAGNCGESGSGEECASVPVGAIAYPAALPTVISVGATTQSDARASFSSFGSTLDVSAPGYAVPSSTSWSTANPTSLYSGALYGTSYASPQVASLAALIKSIHPSASIADVTALINATASKPTGMNGLAYTQQFGHGIINAGSALMVTQVLNTASGTPVLRQTGSSQAEHTAPASTLLGSGCTVPVTGACTVQFTSSTGHVRYLPYSLTTGETGWVWSSDILEAGNWEVRARSGDNISTAPYYLFKKG